MVSSDFFRWMARAFTQKILTVMDIPNTKRVSLEPPAHSIRGHKPLYDQITVRE